MQTHDVQPNIVQIQLTFLLRLVDIPKFTTISTYQAGGNVQNDPQNMYKIFLFDEIMQTGKTYYHIRLKKY